MAAQGVRIGRKRVARLMRASGMHGVSPRRQFVTTRRDDAATPDRDLVSRQFRTTAPNQLWVADITYIATGGGFLFLAVVLDAWSRRVVGWAIASHLRTELVLDALDMALAPSWVRSITAASPIHWSIGMSAMWRPFRRKCSGAST